MFTLIFGSGKIIDEGKVDMTKMKKGDPEYKKIVEIKTKLECISVDLDKLSQMEVSSLVMCGVYKLCMQLQETKE